MEKFSEWIAHSEDINFIRGIWAEKFDTTAILVYCDWMDEQGQGEGITNFIRDSAAGKIEWDYKVRGKIYDVYKHFYAECVPQHISQKVDRNKVIYVLGGQPMHWLWVDRNKTAYAVNYKTCTWQRLINGNEHNARIATPRDRTDTSTYNEPTVNVALKKWPEINLSEVPDCLLQYLFWSVIYYWTSGKIKWGNKFAIARF